MEAKVISRGNGRSAVAAAAYASRSNLYNDYDGIRHNYTLKHDLLWQNVYLPMNAPDAWQDREQLWNAVEAEEPTKDSRLAREFIIALPVELDEWDWQQLLRDYIQRNFVDDGICADVSIHRDADGHNPHAHLMVTVRPLDEHGHWQYKTKKEYLCVRDGIEQGFTADEYAAAKELGWEKQYLFMVDKKKVYMTMADGLAAGYKRVDKHPKSTKYGRQNPITARWNSEEQLLTWREQWAVTTNAYLERAGLSVRVDHRSFADQGITAQPTIHEGVVARALEAKGIVSDRCEINRMIKADNTKLLTEKNDAMVSASEAQESVRDKMILLQYQIHFNDHQRDEIETFLSNTEPDMSRYHAKQNELAILKTKRKGLRADLKNVGVLHPIEAHKLNKQIAEVTEEIEDVTSSRNMILTKLHCPDTKAADKLDRKIKTAHDTRNTILSKQPKLHEQFRQCRSDYRQAATATLPELTDAVKQIRSDHQQRVRAKLEETFGDRFDPWLFEKCVDEIDAIIRNEQQPQHDRSSNNRRGMDAADRQKQKDKAR